METKDDTPHNNQVNSGNGEGNDQEEEEEKEHHDQYSHKRSDDGVEFATVNNVAMASHASLLPDDQQHHSSSTRHTYSPSYGTRDVTPARTLDRTERPVGIEGRATRACPDGENDSIFTISSASNGGSPEWSPTSSADMTPTQSASTLAERKTTTSNQLFRYTHDTSPDQDGNEDIYKQIAQERAARKFSEKKVKHLEQEIELVNSELEAARENDSTVRELENALNNESQRAEELQKRVNHLEEKYEGKHRQYSSQNDSLMRENKELHDKLRGYQDELDEARQENKTVSKEKQKAVEKENGMRNIISELNTEIGSLRKENDTLKRERDKMRATNQQKEKRIFELEERKRSLKTDLQDARANIGHLKDKILTLQHQIDSHLTESSQREYNSAVQIEETLSGQEKLEERLKDLLEERHQELKEYEKKRREDAETIAQYQEHIEELERELEKTRHLLTNEAQQKSSLSFQLEELRKKAVDQESTQLSFQTPKNSFIDESKHKLEGLQKLARDKDTEILRLHQELEQSNRSLSWYNQRLERLQSRYEETNEQLKEHKDKNITLRNQLKTEKREKQMLQFQDNYRTDATFPPTHKSTYQHPSSEEEHHDNNVIETLRFSIESLSADYDELEHERKTVCEERKRLVEKVNEKDKEIMNLRHNLKASTEKLGSKDEEVSVCHNQFQEIKIRLEGEQNKAKSLKEELDNCLSSNRTMKSDLEYYKEKIENTDKENKELKFQMEKQQEENSRVNSRNNFLEQELKDTRFSLDKTKQQLEEYETDLEYKNYRVEELETANESRMHELQENKLQLETLVEKWEANERDNSHGTDVSSITQEHQDRLTVILNRVHENERQLNLTVNQRDKYKEQVDTESKKVENLQNELDELKETFYKYKADCISKCEAYQALVDQYEHLQKEYRSLQNSYTDLKKQQSHYIGLLEDKDSDLVHYRLQEGIHREEISRVKQNYESLYEELQNCQRKLQVKGRKLSEYQEKIEQLHQENKRLEEVKTNDIFQGYSHTTWSNLVTETPGEDGNYLKSTVDMEHAVSSAIEKISFFITHFHSDKNHNVNDNRDKGWRLNDELLHVVDELEHCERHQQTQYFKLHGDFSESQTQLSALEEKYDNLQRSYNRLKQDFDENQYRCHRLQRELDEEKTVKFSNRDQFSGTSEELQRKLADATSSLRSYQRKRDELFQENAELQRERAEQKRQVDGLTEKLKLKQEELQKANEKCDELVKQKDRCVEELHSYKIEVKKKLKFEWNQKVELVESESKYLNESISALNTEIDDVIGQKEQVIEYSYLARKRNHDAIQTLCKSYEELHQQSEDQKEEIALLHEKLQCTEEKLSKCTEGVEEERNAQDMKLAHLQDEEFNLKSSVEKMQRRIQELGASLEEKDKAVQELEELNRKHWTVVRELEIQRDRYQSKCTTLEEKIDKLEDNVCHLRKELEKESALREWNENASNQCLQLRDERIDNLRVQLEQSETKVKSHDKNIHRERDTVDEEYTRAQQELRHVQEELTREKHTNEKLEENFQKEKEEILLLREKNQQYCEQIYNFRLENERMAHNTEDVSSKNKQLENRVKEKEEKLESLDKENHRLQSEIAQSSERETHLSGQLNRLQEEVESKEKELKGYHEKYQRYVGRSTKACKNEDEDLQQLHDQIDLMFEQMRSVHPYIQPEKSRAGKVRRVGLYLTSLLENIKRQQKNLVVVQSNVANIHESHYIQKKKSNSLCQQGMKTMLSKFQSNISITISRLEQGSHKLQIQNSQVFELKSQLKNLQIRVRPTHTANQKLGKELNELRRITHGRLTSKQALSYQKTRSLSIKPGTSNLHMRNKGNSFDQLSSKKADDQPLLTQQTKNISFVPPEETVEEQVVEAGRQRDETMQHARYLRQAVDEAYKDTKTSFHSVSLFIDKNSFSAEEVDDNEPGEATKKRLMYIRSIVKLLVNAFLHKVTIQKEVHSGKDAVEYTKLLEERDNRIDKLEYRLSRLTDELMSNANNDSQLMTLGGVQEQKTGTQVESTNKRDIDTIDTLSKLLEERDMYYERYHTEKGYREVLEGRAESLAEQCQEYKEYLDQSRKENEALMDDIDAFAKRLDRLGDKVRSSAESSFVTTDNWWCDQQERISRLYHLLREKNDQVALLQSQNQADRKRYNDLLWELHDTQTKQQRDALELHGARERICGQDDEISRLWSLLETRETDSPVENYVPKDRLAEAEKKVYEQQQHLLRKDYHIQQLENEVENKKSHAAELQNQMDALNRQRQHEVNTYEDLYRRIESLHETVQNPSTKNVFGQLEEILRRFEANAKSQESSGNAQNTSLHLVQLMDCVRQFVSHNHNGDTSSEIERLHSALSEKLSNISRLEARIEELASSNSRLRDELTSERHSKELKLQEKEKQLREASTNRETYKASLEMSMSEETNRRSALEREVERLQEELQEYESLLKEERVQHRNTENKLQLENDHLRIELEERESKRRQESSKKFTRVDDSMSMLNSQMNGENEFFNVSASSGKTEEQFDELQRNRSELQRMHRRCALLKEQVDNSNKGVLKVEEHKRQMLKEIEQLRESVLSAEKVWESYRLNAKRHARFARRMAGEVSKLSTENEVSEIVKRNSRCKFRVCIYSFYFFPFLPIFCFCRNCRSS